MYAQLVFVVVLTTVASVAHAQAPDRYSLRGRLVDSASGQPLAGVLVYLTKEHDQSKHLQTSAPDGAFNFTGLEPDRYLVTAIIEGENVPFYGFADGSVMNVWVGPDQKTQDFVFPVKRHATISGTVRDEFGDPLATAKVIAYRENWRNGKTVSDLIAVQQTDDRGRYRIRDLPAAKYFICASPTPGLNDQAPQGGEGDFLAPPDPRILTRSCFPGQPSTTFEIDWGEQKAIDFKLQSAPAAYVTGVISPIVQQSYVTLAPIDAPGVLNQQGWLHDGRFEFRVESGQYRLEAGLNQTSDQNHAIVAQRITVEKAGLTGVRLTPKASGRVDIAVEGAADAKVPHPAQVGFQPVDPDTAFTLWSSVGVDGNAHLENLAPGRYWLVKRMTEPYCVESATLDGEDVLYRTFDVTPGAASRLRIKLTTQCASFSGVVLSGGKPVFMGRIAVLISGSPTQPGDVCIDSTNETGEFSMILLPPGRYLVWAWRQDPSYAGPASLADAVKSAVAVDLRKGQKATGLVVRDLREEAR